MAMDFTTSTLRHLTISAAWGGTTVITPSEDSVGDIKIVSNSYDAESGRFSGAQIQVTSKPAPMISIVSAPTRRQQSRIPGGKMGKIRLSGFLTINGMAIIWLCLTSSAVA